MATVVALPDDYRGRLLICGVLGQVEVWAAPLPAHAPQDAVRDCVVVDRRNGKSFALAPHLSAKLQSLRGPRRQQLIERIFGLTAKSNGRHVARRLVEALTQGRRGRRVPRRVGARARARRTRSTRPRSARGTSSDDPDPEPPQFSEGFGGDP